MGDAGAHRRADRPRCAAGRAAAGAAAAPHLLLTPAPSSGGGGHRPRPTLSVVVPVRDDDALLERCLQALDRQTAPADEIVVVDNGGSEATARIAARHGARCVREPHPGIPAASAAGYDAARGELLARLDADSVPPRDWAARIVEAFTAEPELDALTGPGDFVALPRAPRWMATALYMNAYFRVFGWVAGHPPLFGSNLVMRRELWGRTRGLIHRDDALVHDDLDLSLCLPRDARIRCDPSFRVAVSARPFGDPRGFLRRIRRALHTLAVNRSAIARRFRPRRSGARAPA